MINAQGRPATPLVQLKHISPNDDGQASPVFPNTPGEALHFVRPAARARALEAIIADRIEGKAGTRRDDDDPENERRRVDMQAVIEFVVTAMVNVKLVGANDSPEDSATDRTPVVIDVEEPR